MFVQTGVPQLLTRYDLSGVDIGTIINDSGLPFILDLIDQIDYDTLNVYYYIENTHYDELKQYLSNGGLDILFRSPSKTKFHYQFLEHIIDEHGIDFVNTPDRYEPYMFDLVDQLNGDGTEPYVNSWTFKMAKSILDRWTESGIDVISQVSPRGSLLHILLSAYITPMIYQLAIFFIKRGVPVNALNIIGETVLFTLYNSPISTFTPMLIDILVVDHGIKTELVNSYGMTVNDNAKRVAHNVATKIWFTNCSLKTRRYRNDNQQWDDNKNDIVEYRCTDYRSAESILQDTFNADNFACIIVTGEIGVSLIEHYKDFIESCGFTIYNKKNPFPSRNRTPSFGDMIVFDNYVDKISLCDSINFDFATFIDT